MFWLRKKEKTVWEPSTDIIISKTPYEETEPATPNHHMLCVSPKYCDEDKAFSAFMRLCAKRLLAEYPFVVEQISNAVKHLRGQPFIDDFLDSGGKVIIPQQERLLAISEQQKLRLITLLPERSLSGYWCDIYAFCNALPAKQLLDPSFDLLTSGFDLHLFCSEFHDYFLMESTQDLAPFIDVIRTVCQEQERELILE